MIIIRAIWALFLAGFVAYTFHRSWGWEHGDPMPEPIFGGNKPRAKETTVWLDPRFLPIMLLIILILLGAMHGMDGVRQFLSLSLDVMFVISIYFLLLVFLLPVFRRYFSARACASMWILPVFMFWQAHIIMENTAAPLFVIYIPSHILEILFLIWTIGFVVVFTGKFISHLLFRHRVMSVSIPIRDPEVLELFEQELNRLEYYHPVSLVISSAVSVPLSMGTRKKTRVTVLPNREFTKQELQFIFSHEIHHLQRCDVSNKIFFAFCQALCWFNPLIWVATRKASDDLELSCDEIVLENMDEEKRRQYATLLLNTAGHSGGFTTCLSAAAETMRYRLKNVVTIRKRWPGTLMLSIAMFLCVMSYGTIAVSHDRGTVTELITEYRTAEDVRSVYYQPEGETRLREVFAWDSEGLFSYLAALDVEKLSSANEINDLGGQRLSVVVDKNGTMQLLFHDKFIEVYHYHNGGRREYFYLRSELDWEIIKKTLDLNAEKTMKARLLDPQMLVYFDVADQNDPFVAIRSHFRAWNADTGETILSSDNSDPAGGLVGFDPTQAQIVFNMPVSEIRVWVREWDSTAQVSGTLEVGQDCYILCLEDYSAHYQVDVVDEAAALDALDRFAERWDKKYPKIAQSWRDHWPNLSTYFKFPAEIHRLIYTTNAIEGFNRQLRKVTKAKIVFPTDDSLLKMLYLAMVDITRSGQGVVRIGARSTLRWWSILRTECPINRKFGAHQG